MEGISGAEAVGLWFDYKEGDLGALRKLIRYNHADIEGMKSILERVVNRLDPEVSGDATGGRLFERSSVCFDESRDETVSTPYGSPLQRSRRTAIEILRLAQTRGRLDRVTIVGIDLTGSEERKSGWASVMGQNVTTVLVATDEELIGKTVSAKPFLVSVDSPLSLPAGRLSEFDDDPGRGRLRDRPRGGTAASKERYQRISGAVAEHAAIDSPGCATGCGP